MLRKLSSFVAICVMGIASTANADVLLQVDLSVTDQVTITATSGLSAVSGSGSDGIGVYLENFYSGPRLSGVTETLVSGDLTNAENPGNNLPNLFTFGLTDTGLNIFAWSDDTTVSFTAGQLAFTGSATWTLDNADYIEMLAGNTSGDLWFPADDASDLAGAQILGQWEVITAIPEPGSALVIGGLMATGLFIRRRI